MHKVPFKACHKTNTLLLLPRPPPPPGREITYPTYFLTAPPMHIAKLRHLNDLMMTTLFQGKRPRTLDYHVCVQENKSTSSLGQWRHELPLGDHYVGEGRVVKLQEGDQVENYQHLQSACARISVNN